MLVLTRHAGEAIMIGDEIEISIIDVQGDKAKIGITAPRDVRILRRELIDEVRSTNAQAAAVNVSLDTFADALIGKDRNR
jgi:carbon storage regulator